jgi:hypothetical protein
VFLLNIHICMIWFVTLTVLDWKQGTWGYTPTKRKWIHWYYHSWIQDINNLLWANEDHLIHHQLTLKCWAWSTFPWLGWNAWVSTNHILLRSNQPSNSTFATLSSLLLLSILLGCQLDNLIWNQYQMKEFGNLLMREQWQHICQKRNNPNF